MNTPPAAQPDRSKLSLSYDVGRLQDEVHAVLDGSRPYIHYDVVPLTRAGEPKPGATDFSDPDWTTWSETPTLTGCTYIKEILDSLDCRKTNVRLLRLEPGGTISLHSDPQLDLGLENQVRLHVPVFTSDQVAFVLNDEPVPMRPGELWYMRLSDPHSVVNAGEEERVHLSIDVVVNEWVETMIGQTE